MKKVRLIASKLNVEIEADMMVIYTVEDDDSEGVVIPLSYASIVNIDDGTYPDDSITFTLGIKYIGECSYFEKQTNDHRHIRSTSDRNIRLSFCIHKTIDDVMSSYFIDNDLAKTLVTLLNVIEDLNYEYLRTHSRDPDVIKNISETVNAVKKAKRIVSKKLKPKDQGTEKIDER